MSAFTVVHFSSVRQCWNQSVSKGDGGIKRLRSSIDIFSEWDTCVVTAWKFRLVTTPGSDRVS